MRIGQLVDNLDFDAEVHEVTYNIKRGAVSLRTELKQDKDDDFSSSGDDNFINKMQLC